MFNKQNNDLMMPLLLVGGLLIFRMFSSQNDVDDEESTNEGYTQPATSQAEPKPQPKEKNVNTWYYVGNKGGAINKIQTRCNMIISLCKSAVKDGAVSNVTNPTTKARVKKIANWEKLKNDGNFGNKTGAFVQYLTGKNNTSLAVVRQKYIAFHQILY